MARKKTTATSRKLFQQGFAEMIYKWPPPIMTMNKRAHYSNPSFEDAQVAWDMLQEGGFSLEELRDYLIGIKVNIVTMGRLVGALSMYNQAYFVLRRDNRLRGKPNDFYLYRADVEVAHRTSEMLMAEFMLSQGGEAEIPRLEWEPLGNFEPSRWFSPNVMTEQSLEAYRRREYTNPWLGVYEYALPLDMPVPRLPEFGHAHPASSDEGGGGGEQLELF